MYPDIRTLEHLSSGNFFLMAGPCVIENEVNPFEIASEIKKLADRHKVPFIFKASYRKANRSRVDSFTGIGDEKALGIIADVGNRLNVPTVTDIHESKDADMAARFVDVLQIPAFLCRQSELLMAAGKTGKVVNIKKGQFLSAASMKFAVEKVKATGNNNVMLTERGTMLGYQDLVVDFRGIPAMQAMGVPVVLDITHSLQQPNQASGVTGGQPELISTIAKAGIAAGADGIFVETHPDPANALSDGANMLKLDRLDELLTRLISIRQAI